MVLAIRIKTQVSTMMYVCTAAARAGMADNLVSTGRTASQRRGNQRIQLGQHTLGIGAGLGRQQCDMDAS